MASIMRRLAWSVAGVVLLALQPGCVSTQYSQLVTERKPIPRVSVTTSYKAAGVYQVEVVNNTRNTITLLWNSSAYLNTSGETIRLVHLENAEVLPEVPPLLQRPSAIRRRGKLKTYFAGESWLDYSRRGVAPKPKNSDKKAVIYLAFEIEGKRIYWKGEVTFSPLK